MRVICRCGNCLVRGAYKHTFNPLGSSIFMIHRRVFSLLTNGRVFFVSLSPSLSEKLNYKSRAVLVDLIQRHTHNSSSRWFTASILISGDCLGLSAIAIGELSCGQENMLICLQISCASPIRNWQIVVCSRFDVIPLVGLSVSSPLLPIKVSEPIYQLYRIY